MITKTKTPIVAKEVQGPIDRIREVVEWDTENREKLVRKDDLAWLLSEYDRLNAFAGNMVKQTTKKFDFRSQILSTKKHV